MGAIAAIGGWGVIVGEFVVGEGCAGSGVDVGAGVTEGATTDGGEVAG